ncbi:MAG TPA: ABC transporter permease [Candidatus Kapabacteria bacterium]|nr:ABC transporter permease [Candidatus Kapabacteria bacterium]
MKRISHVLVDWSSLILFVLVLGVFGTLSSKFFTWVNLENLLVQSSATAVIATGMTFVLLTAGVDLSVGAIMFIAAAIAGKLLLAGFNLPVALFAIISAGVLCGAINALLIARLKIVAFIATLATLYAGRGFGLWITQTRAMNLPEVFLQIGTTRFGGIPLPIIVFAATVMVAHLTLSRTPFGRQLYALGGNVEAARKAGLKVNLLLASVYIICGFCAAVGCILSLAQLGAVSPTFGTNREFAAIAAAVLGGTSLFGGRGKVFPGTVLGALLIQSVENGLVIINADPYLYPLVTSAIIFIAVFIDSTRQHFLTRAMRRKIFVEERV